jgi:transposase-like protein
MVNIRNRSDEAWCYPTVREMRLSDWIRCPHCSSESAIEDGRDDTPSRRQRSLCHGCQRRFDDLTGTGFAGHHQPLRTWIGRLDFMGLNRSSLQIAKELELARSDVQAMVQQLRQGAASLPCIL